MVRASWSAMDPSNGAIVNLGKDYPDWETAAAELVANLRTMGTPPAGSTVTLTEVD